MIVASSRQQSKWMGAVEMPLLTSENETVLFPPPVDEVFKFPSHSFC
jgi:hypothetical protein